jgi:hypothetical protein
MDQSATAVTLFTKRGNIMKETEETVAKSYTYLGIGLPISTRFPNI